MFELTQVPLRSRTGRRESGASQPSESAFDVILSKVMDDRAKARTASNLAHWYVLMMGVLLTCTQCAASVAATDAGADVVARWDVGADVVARCPMSVVDGSVSQQPSR